MKMMDDEKYNCVMVNTYLTVVGIHASFVSNV